MREQSDSYRNVPVNLVEPSSGTTVKLEVSVENEKLASEIISHITQVVVAIGSKCNVSGNIISIEFPNESIAEGFREGW